MKTKKVQMKLFYEYATCDDCGTTLEDGLVLLSNPPKYQYICPKCGKIIVLDERYPKQVIEPMFVANASLVTPKSKGDK